MSDFAGVVVFAVCESRRSPMFVCSLQRASLRGWTVRLAIGDGGWSSHMVIQTRSFLFVAQTLGGIILPFAQALGRARCPVLGSIARCFFSSHEGGGWGGSAGCDARGTGRLRSIGLVAGSGGRWPIFDDGSNLWRRRDARIPGY